ncbi:MAG: DAK2 domain-containing protein [Syntrophomonadaceae bacterium]|nr:DAK2 domain-containing protein [Syntrophomonadaceae bacterium]MDD3024073.1 DAK2 domain-containing protein [Syntrophomonadaceae bacterium]
MSLTYINGNDFVRMVKYGCIKLEHNRDSVDLLNVFPVPDGDTGTNMYLTLLSAVKEGEKNYGSSLGKAAKAISMGSLMGARGNSGVILSQVFRGFARTMEGKEQADAIDLALALRSGSETAYEAVMKPIEGTILTVIREIARACEIEAKKKKDIVSTLMAGIQAGYTTLARTPAMLPILKEAGVVDAGGQGLLFFLEGALEGLIEEKDILLDDYRDLSPTSLINKKSDSKLQIEFQYCTEVLIKGMKLDVKDIKDHLAPLGDSMLVVGDDELIKVHIHSNHPGKVLESCLQWGNLSDIKINNMQEEIHNHINNWEENQPEMTEPLAKIGLVAVGAGDGIIKILKSLGVNVIVEGGQTMNPSTEDLLNACKEVDAQSIIILPNNSNIIMTALQVKQLYDKVVEIVPSRSVMQAITALIAFNPDGDIEVVSAAMSAEIEQVKYAEVTYAVRDSSINGLEIKMGDTIGILGDNITVSAANPAQAVEKLIQKMIDNNSQLITIVYGQDINENEASELGEKIQEMAPDSELDMHYGGQPHYSYLISVE